MRTLYLWLLCASSLAAQTVQPSSQPAQSPIPGAPTSTCEFPHIDSDTPLRITSGNRSIPFQFACGFNRPAGECVTGTLSPGLIVNLGPEEHGWACITGRDSVSGWVPANLLSAVPASPSVPLTDWLGWWRIWKQVPGYNNPRLLIVRKPGSRMLYVSGRAYWYGAHGIVHYGQIQADAVPIGLYLHAVEASDDGTACVLDLKLDPATHTLQAYDNMQCGGMNVNFAGKWARFHPK